MLPIELQQGQPEPADVGAGCHRLPAAVSVNGLTRAQSTDQASRDGKRVGFHRVKRPGREIVPGLDNDGKVTAQPPIAAKHPPHARPRDVLHQATGRNRESFHAGSISARAHERQHEPARAFPALPVDTTDRKGRRTFPVSCAAPRKGIESP